MPIERTGSGGRALVILLLVATSGWVAAADIDCSRSWILVRPAQPVGDGRLPAGGLERTGVSPSPLLLA